MIIIRTDGGGTFHENERLENLRKILKIIPFQNLILKLHDHKGELTVLWNTEPTNEEKDILNGLWFLFAEYNIKHETL